MSLRKLCKQTRKPASKALFVFPDEKKTGIAPTRFIVEKDIDYREGLTVHVNWEGKRVKAEILALSDDDKVLLEKDLDWSRKNVLVEISQDSEEPPQRCPQKKSASVDIQRDNTEKGIPGSDDPYEQFLAGQRKREIEWKEVRKSKKVKVAAPIPAPMVVASSSESPLKDDRVATLQDLLAAKTEECRHLMNRLDAMEEFSRKIIANQMKMQENFDKMLGKLDSAIIQTESKLLTAMQDVERNVGNAIFKLDVRLESLEERPLNQYSMINSTEFEEEITPLLNVAQPSEDCDDLSTINLDTLGLMSVGAEVQQTVSSQVEQAEQTVIGEELVVTCVTPSKVKVVQETLGKENERHLCALKLLQSIFAKEELASSNTDGTYGKKCLDATKLNSLKALVFSRFPANANEDREKIWRSIKSKINTKCRSIRKCATKESPVRSL
ncbi:uncharacterized protein [Montipora capricornis]|uniref:uncharacterized protein n=1 Tax=Montipora capricornis TaxID=246305 RepID=UPI0035F11E52